MISRVAASLALALLGSALCAGTAAAAEGRTMSLSASKFDFAAEPGQAGTGEVTVINEGDEPISVRVYAANQVIAEGGSATYVVPPVDANPLSSPASWLTFELPADAKSTGNVPYVELGPKGRTPVTFTVSVPEGAAPGDRQVVLFFEMFSPGQGEGGTARINARLGARIETRVKGEVVEKLTVQPFTVPAFVVGSEVPYAFTMRNDGNVDVDVGVRIATLDRSENEKGSSEILTNTPVYAGASLQREGTFELPGLAIGPQQVRLIAAYTGDSGLAKSVEKDRTVWAAPLWLLIAVGAAIALAVLAGVWAVSRRATERRIERRGSTADEPFSNDEYYDPESASG